MDGIVDGERKEGDREPGLFGMDPDGIRDAWLLAEEETDLMMDEMVGEVDRGALLPYTDLEELGSREVKAEAAMEGSAERESEGGRELSARGCTYPFGVGNRISRAGPAGIRAFGTSPYLNPRIARESSPASPYWATFSGVP